MQVLIFPSWVYATVAPLVNWRYSTPPIQDAVAFPVIAANFRSNQPQAVTESAITKIMIVFIRFLFNYFHSALTRQLTLTR